MKTPNYKTVNLPKKKRLAIYTCVIVAICFLNLGTVKAQDPVSQTKQVNTQQAPSTPQITVKTETLFENFDQKANQLFNLLSTVMKSMKEMKQSVTRNTN